MTILVEFAEKAWMRGIVYGYRLGIRTAVAAPLKASPAVPHPTDAEGHLFCIARSFSGNTGREEQVSPWDSATYRVCGACGPAHPKPIKSMTSRPMRIGTYAKNDGDTLLVG